MAARHKTMGVYVPVYREGPCDKQGLLPWPGGEGVRAAEEERAEGERVKEGGS